MTISIEDHNLLAGPKEFALGQNYPNPFSSNTTIKYSVPEPDNISIKVFDVIGREVFKKVERVTFGGTYEFSLDGNNLKGGIYYYQFKSTNYQMTKKCILLK